MVCQCPGSRLTRYITALLHTGMLRRLFRQHAAQNGRIHVHAGIPRGFKVRETGSAPQGKPYHFRRVGVTAHETKAGNGLPVPPEQDGQCLFVQYSPCVGLQMRAVASGTSVGTVGDVYGQGSLVGYLGENYVVVVELQGHAATV